MVHEGQHLVVQVRVDEDLHELELQSLFEMLHDRRERALVLAERVAAETGPQGDLELRGSPEAVPDAVGWGRWKIDRQSSTDGVKLKNKSQI